MKLLIFAAISIALTISITSALPYKEKVFDGYVLEGVNYKTSNLDSFFAEFPGDEKILVSFIEGRLVAENNTCTNQYQHNVCYKGMTFDHYNYSLLNSVVNKALITIETDIAKLNITRDIPQAMNIGQEYKVKTTIQNIADRPAENVVFSDYFPKDLDVYLTSNCNLILNNISWTGRLEPAQKVQCTYIIRPLKNITYVSKAYADYNNGIRIQREETATTINVDPYPLQVSERATNYSPDIGSEVALNFTLYSSKNITVDYFILTIPNEFSILKSDNALTRIENKLTFSGVMKENETKVFKNLILAQYYGNYTVSSIARFKMDDLTGTIEMNVPINASFKEPYVRIGKTNLDKNSGQISIFIINPSNHTFKEVSMSIKGLINANQSENSLSGLSHKEYVYDYSSPDGEHNMSIILKYKTEYYQKFIQMTNEQISINTSINEKLPDQKIAAETKPKQETTTTATETENKTVSINIKKGFEQAKIFALLFAGLIILVVTLGFLAAKLKKKEKTEDNVEPELKDLIK